MELVDKLVTVVGLSKRTGVETVKFLVQQGAKVIATDTKSQTKLAEEINLLDDYEVDLDLGGHTPELILNSDLIVISPGVPIDIPLLNQARGAGIEVISEVELAYRYTTAQILAITGSNGKTTTTMLTGEIFKETDFKTIVGGNIGRALIKDLPYLSKEDLAIAEISSFQLEGTKEFRPKISLVLNLTPDHLDRHGTFENYAAAKKKIVVNQRKEDYAILNYDDQDVRQFANSTAAEVVFFSQQEELEKGVFVTDNKIVSNLKGQTEEIISIEQLGLKGPHNLENALGAIAMSLLMGVSKDKLVKVLSEFTSVEHRIEGVATIKGVKYVNDSKGTNPAAAIKALETFNEPIILIAGGMNKESDFTDFAKIAANKIKGLVLLGETADEIEDKVKEFGFTDTYQVSGIEEATHQASQLASQGDIVLLSPACASWDMFSSYKHRGKMFKKAVQSLRRG
ncbi:UDP-N-acetylmuramoylalanine--D-glutamate ligase [Halobacteroides halobius DSM 5150]|uniref:UDP-N-acetylmuramoylalanine--D-glutamate ligase n=1 Tax=Halobacteroides halobius (strain ATCC 35273 / DSM 5150 / MD-1) TaxID=748449 RepID=L0K9L4_HALHC|nr:UDP-N-acetylmuramoyl-L-alanine--D-glutamate ligase [Halobacteroides halobius]AGB41706.1 UDP-N-acetylmuramoylalanine--D-glutamate ligase [Halobacteroides halobius DSM 5150]